MSLFSVSIVGGPGAVSWGPGRMDVVARESNGTVKHWYYTGGNWYSGNWPGEPDTPQIEEQEFPRYERR